MNNHEKIRNLRDRMEENLCQCILPFWREYMQDDVHGGFYGRVDGKRRPDLQSPKSVVLNCRMLWTYSRAWKLYGNARDMELAGRAYDCIRTCFWDPVYKGVFWMTTCKGEPSEPEKRTYGQAFLIYAMTEYYRVFQEPEAIEMAMETFYLVEDRLKLKSGGYADSAARDWRKDDWVNFWVKNRGGAAKLLNSNMHLFEAILLLAEVTGEPDVIQALKEELEFLLHTAVDPELGHLKAGMAEDGARLDGEVNFGHDCECSYLMMEAAEFLKDEELLKETEKAVAFMMDRVYEEGLDPVNGGMYYIVDYLTKEVNRSKIWWVQAEGITAFFDRFQRTGKEKYLDAAISIWNYVESCMVNRELGEWYSVGKNLKAEAGLQEQEEALSAVFTNDEMAGKGKCPYHNSRVCFEIMERAEAWMKSMNSEKEKVSGNI